MPRHVRDCAWLDVAEELKAMAQEKADEAFTPGTDHDGIHAAGAGDDGAGSGGTKTVNKDDAEVAGGDSRKWTLMNRVREGSSEEEDKHVRIFGVLYEYLPLFAVDSQRSLRSHPCEPLNLFFTYRVLSVVIGPLSCVVRRTIGGTTIVLQRGRPRSPSFSNNMTPRSRPRS